jgi:ribosomal protein L40E
MAKFAEAHKRLFQNIFVCKDCKTKFRAQQMKVLAGKVSCRSCKSKALRTVRLK